MKKLLLLFLLPLAAFSQTQQQCDQGRCSGLGAPVGICTPGSKYTQVGGAGNQPTLWQCGGIPPSWVAGGITDNTKVPLAGGTMSGSLTTPSLMSSIQPVINVTAYGATGDGLSSTAASYTSGSAIIAVPTASFTSADANKILVLKSAAPKGSPITITACSVALNVVTLTAANSFVGTEMIVPSGFTGPCAFLDNRVMQVNSANLTSSSLTANFTATNLSTSSDNGTAVQASDVMAKIASVTDSTHVISTIAPTVTVSGNATVVWATDSTAFLQAAFNQACSATLFPRGGIGAKVPQVYFPQGEFHITNTLSWQCGQIQGIPGAAGSRIAWDGPNGIPAIDRPSTGPGNSNFKGVEMYADSFFFVPTYWVLYEELVDQETDFANLTLQGASQGIFKFTNGFVNFHFSHISMRSFCGDGMDVVFGTGGSRNNFALDSSQMDFGGAVQVAQGCQTRSAINFDNSISQQPAYATIRISNMRIEDQISTVVSGTHPGVFVYTSGAAGGASPNISSTELDNLTLNFINPNQHLALLSSDDSTGSNCPAILAENLSWNAGIGSFYQSGNGTYCGSQTIIQPQEFQDGLTSASFMPYFPGLPSDVQPWRGNLPANSVQDSGIKLASAYWTQDAGYSVGHNCGGDGGNCFQITGTGSPLGFPHVTSAPIPVVPGLTYNYSGYVDCSANTAGNLGWTIQGAGITSPNGLCTPGSKGYLSGTVTIPGGTTSVQMIITVGNATVPNGAVLKFSNPQLTLGSSPEPYRENDFDTVNGIIPAAALPPAPGTIVGNLDLAAQTTNVALTTIYAVPATPAFTYFQACAWEIINTAATTSSTLPSVRTSSTDPINSVVVSEFLALASSAPSGGAANTTATAFTGCSFIHARAGTNIQIQTSGYASSGATPMSFDLHATLTGIR